MRESRRSSTALRAGDLCAFATLPTTPFSAPSTGRHAVLKVLTANKIVVYLVLSGVFDQRPELHQAAALPPLCAERFVFDGRPAILSTRPDWEVDLPDFTLLGNVEVTSDELALIPKFPSFGTWRGASSHAEGEWRWRNDREAYRREIELDEAAKEETRQAERAHHENRLKHLTWQTLLAETMFARWSPSPPFPPDEFTDAVRARFHDAILEMQSMVPNPNKKMPVASSARWLPR